jgi:hypothetical protein
MGIGTRRESNRDRSSELGRHQASTHDVLSPRTLRALSILGVRTRFRGANQACRGFFQIMPIPGTRKEALTVKDGASLAGGSDDILQQFGFWQRLITKNEQFRNDRPNIRRNGAQNRRCEPIGVGEQMVTTLILILGGVLLAALAVIYLSVVRRRQPRK